MLAQDGGSWWTAVEALVWSVPAVGALALAASSPTGERRQWGLIAAVCAVFALDEPLDVLGRAHQLAQRVARAIDPENALRGDTLIWRVLILGAGAVAALAVLVFLFRGRRVGLPRWIAFSGVCTVAVYVIMRLVPGIGDATAGPVGWGILALAWCLLVGGQVLELDRRRDA